jgi:hypothetical protein
MLFDDRTDDAVLHDSPQRTRRLKRKTDKTSPLVLTFAWSRLSLFCFDPISSALKSASSAGHVPALFSRYESEVQRERGLFMVQLIKWISILATHLVGVLFSFVICVFLAYSAGCILGMIWGGQLAQREREQGNRSTYSITLLTVGHLGGVGISFGLYTAPLWYFLCVRKGIRKRQSQPSLAEPDPKPLPVPVEKS